MRALLSSWVLAAWAWASPGPSLLEEGAHCVAYRAEKVVLFVARSEVVGRNCDVSAQVLPEVGGLYHIEVNIPLRSFRSGDTDRDQDIMRVLRAAERSELTFRSQPLTVDEWKKRFAAADFFVDGQLTIGGHSYPIRLQSHYSEKPAGAEVDGVAKVRLHDLGISPPRVLGGVVAKAKPDVELHFHLLSQRILGADSLRLGHSGE